MPPDSQNEQELMLKKRARRRLVGAIALVLLMIILLPQVLQDRAAQTQQDPIKIVMQDAGNSASAELAAAENQTAPAASAEVMAGQAVPSEVPVQTSEPLPQSQKSSTVDVPVVKSNPTEAINSVAKDAANKDAASKEATSKAAEPAVAAVQTPAQASEMFTVQVGVYSDAANVKRLQEQLKQAGFVTKTEKIKTAKGETIKLKAGSYQSRQEATLALAKIKDLGLSGMVVSQ